MLKHQFELELGVNESSRHAQAKPILRWVGGKRFVLSHLLKHAPRDVADRRYIEPFVGAGSMFFAVRPRDALLADLNEHLIRCYESVRERPDLVSQHLRRHAHLHSPEYYYDVRETYNRSGFGPPHAARFIYLNQTCFNGVFRVNKRGQFNVPLGDKANPAFPSSEALRDAAQALDVATLLTADYADTCSRARRGDFIYLDPPYPPLNGTSYFTHYTADRFSEEDQRRLAKVFASMAAKGCLVMMSNADTSLVRALYRDFHLHPLTVTRFVTCKTVRHRVRELIITNYA